LILINEADTLSQPVVGTANFASVKIKNRATQRGLIGPTGAALDMRLAYRSGMRM